MRRFLPELIALPLLPFLLVQGKRTRRITPRLPEADGPTSGVSGAEYAGKAVSLLTVGESPVAGVGVCTHEEAITGQLAQELAACLRRPVEWQARGKNGVTAREALEQVLPHIPPRPIDIALVAFGVNDTTAFHAEKRWARDMRGFLDALEARCRPSLVLLSGVPPMARFPSLPSPLREVLGLKAQVLDRSLRRLALERGHSCHVPLTIDPMHPAFMASDGYHPSAAGCSAWAASLVQAIDDRLHELPRQIPVHS